MRIPLLIGLIVASLASTLRAETIRVNGRVIGPDDKPVPNAVVLVPGEYSWNDRLYCKPVARATADQNGKFEIDFDIAAAASPPVVIATADNLGLGWSRASREMTITLRADDVPIEGRIVDETKQPVAGASVTIFHVGPIDQAEVDAAWKADPDLGRAMSLYLPFVAMERPAIKTDADGRFRVTGIGRDRSVWMFVHGAGIGFSRIEACTKVMEPVTRTVDQPIGTTDKFTTYGAQFEYVARPSQSVEGIIRDATTKQPLANMRVWSNSFARPFEGYSPQGMLSCRSGADGRYRLDGFPRGPGNSIAVVPDDGQGYFMHSQPLDEAAGNEPANVDIELHKGVLVSGRIINKVTREPVRARMEYTTYLDNEHTENLPTFDRQDGGFIHGLPNRYQSKADGTYRMVVAPGKAIIGATSVKDGQFRKGAGFDQIEVFGQEQFLVRLFQPTPFPQHTNVVREIDIPADAKTATCDLEMDPGDTIRVNVVAPDARTPIGKIRVRGISPENYGGMRVKTVEGAEFDALAFAPNETRAIIVLDDANARGRVALASVANAAGKSLTVELAPMAIVTGKLINAEDVSPVANAHIQASVSDAQLGGSVTARTGKTESDGSFSIMLPFGATYYIMVDRGKFVGRTLAQELTPQPDERIDLGEIKLKPR